MLHCLKLAVVFALIAFSVAKSHHKRRRWSERPANTEDIPDSGTPRLLAQALSEDSGVTYSDYEQGMTAIKDPTFRACYIADLDPFFSISEEEKRELKDVLSPILIKSQEEEWKLRERVGPYITSMCRQYALYWLASDHFYEPDRKLPPSILAGSSHVAPPHRAAAVPRFEGQAPAMMIKPPSVVGNAHPSKSEVPFVAPPFIRNAHASPPPLKNLKAPPVRLIPPLHRHPQRLPTRLVPPLIHRIPQIHPTRLAPHPHQNSQSPPAKGVHVPHLHRIPQRIPSVSQPVKQAGAMVAPPPVDVYLSQRLGHHSASNIERVKSPPQLFQHRVPLEQGRGRHNSVHAVA